MKLTNAFADHLGVAYGVCIRDQFRFIFREFARTAGYSVPFLDLFFIQESARFRALLAAHLEAVAVFATLEASPEIRENDKIARKIAFQTQLQTETFLAKKLFQKMEQPDLSEYLEAKKRLMDIAFKPDAMKNDISDAFLEIFHGKDSPKITEDRRYEFAKQTGMAAKAFRGIFDVACKNFATEAKAEG
ncbi:MAG TPA: hypothetical protein DCW60_04495 [Sutterella sp.]|nr:hypothetical protein [Sutterella sp.]